MTLPDDSSLTPSQLRNVRRQSERLLEHAGAKGVFPTPINEILAAAEVEVADESLDEGLVKGLYRGAKKLVKSAVSKLLGLFHAVGRVIFVDRSLHEKKIIFIKLHETGHSWLPHQRRTYAFLEDCEESLDPDARDVFEREANVFASEILFQNEQFAVEAADCSFGIKVPLKLSKRYGSSVYSAMRRYVETSPRACALLVFNPPEQHAGFGFRVRLRRTVQSTEFTRLFGKVQWPESVRSGDALASVVPVGRKMSSPQPCKFVNADGAFTHGSAEGFATSYQVFVLINARGSDTSARVVVPSR